MPGARQGIDIASDRDVLVGAAVECPDWYPRQIAARELHRADAIAGDGHGGRNQLIAMCREVIPQSDRPTAQPGHVDARGVDAVVLQREAQERVDLLGLHAERWRSPCAAAQGRRTDAHRASCCSRSAAGCRPTPGWPTSPRPLLRSRPSRGRTRAAGSAARRSSAGDTRSSRGSLPRPCRWGEASGASWRSRAHSSTAR